MGFKGGVTIAITKSIPKIKEDVKPTIDELLEGISETLRITSELVKVLATESKGGKSNDQLSGPDVRKLINCKASKACEIIRKYGTGSGKMGRIERGTLIRLQKEGKL